MAKQRGNGEGSITEVRPGVYRLKVRRGRDPITGRYDTASRNVKATSRRDALTQLRFFVREVEAGKIVIGHTFGQLAEHWYQHVAGKLSPTTLDAYRINLDRHILPRLGATNLGDMTPFDLDQFASALRASDLSPNTVRNIHAIARRILNQGVRWGWLSESPANRAERPKGVKVEPTPPNPAQVRALIAAAETKRNRDLAAMLFVSATLGTRRGELCGLQWRDVDFERGMLTVRRAVVRDGDSLRVKDPKTHAIRVVSLDAATIAILTLHHELVTERAKKSGEPIRRDAFVFSPNADGSVPIQPRTVSQAFRRLCQSAGVTGVRLHDFRHFMAMRLLSAGTPIHTVQRRLGHERASTTLDIYGHAIAADDLDAAKIMGALMSPIPD